MKPEIKESLEPMFKRAREYYLWFKSTYDPSLVFTPDELEQVQAEGRFQWGAANWALIDPLIIIKNIELEIINKKRELKAIRKRIHQPNPSLRSE